MPFRNMKPTHWPTGIVAFGALAEVIVGLTAFSSPAAAQFGLREIPPKNEFFRFKAQYTVKATGEAKMGPGASVPGAVIGAK